MSQTQEAEPDDQVDDAAPPLNEDVERVARANGWKPKADFKGDESRWVPADVFVARGLENPAILENRNKALADRLERNERILDATKRDLTAKLDQALDSLTTVTQMSRTAEQRAYDRARRELKEEQAKAVETGDTARYHSLDRQVEELDKTKPVDPPPRSAPVQQQPAAPTMEDPAIQRFYAANDWYHGTTKDPDMAAFADGVYAQRLRQSPAAATEDHLNHVVNEVRQRFPDRFGIPRQQANGADRSQARVEDNDRRDDPPVVTPSGGGSPRRQVNRFTFDTMPKESKDAFTRYAKQLQGKGDPLTKEEWAETYWSQFRDDGA